MPDLDDKWQIPNGVPNDSASVLYQTTKKVNKRKFNINVNIYATTKVQPEGRQSDSTINLIKSASKNSNCFNPLEFTAQKSSGPLQTTVYS